MWWKKSIDISEKEKRNEEQLELDLVGTSARLRPRWLWLAAALLGFGLLGLLGLRGWLPRSAEEEKVATPKAAAGVEIGYLSEIQRLVLRDDFLTAITAGTDSLPLSWSGIRDIEQVLSWTFGLRHLRRGDSLVILWRMPVVEGIAQPELKEIQALRVRTASLDSTLEAYLFAAQGGEAFFDATGRPLQGAFLSSPVKYGRISSLYDLNRLNPVLKRVKPHKGTDFAAPMGTPILALADGVVAEISENGANGKFIRLAHGSVYRTTYLHLNACAPHLAENDSVQQGQVIGEVGSTGSSTGPHVCLRFYLNDYQADFVHLFPHLPKRPALPDSLLRTFLPFRDSLSQLMKGEPG